MTRHPASHPPTHGDPQLWSRVYGELRQLAARLLGDEPSGHTLQPTALVHEAFLRLVDADASLAERRELFFGAAARAMRQILVDHARARRAAKRGGDRARQPLATELAGVVRCDEWLVTLDDTVRRLERFDPQLAELVELRYFAGLTFPQAAAVMGVAPITAKRLWKLAKGWLHREMADD